MISYLKRNPNLLFALFLVAFFFLHRYEEVSMMKPFGTHSWRQADSYSFALNYYNDNLPLFQPRLNYINGTEKIEAVSEFPVVYYIVGKLWKIFGHHPFIFRLFDFTILVLGLFSLFNLCNHLFQKPFLSVFVVAMLASSPVISYYGNNYLPDTVALSLSLCAWYFFYQFYSTQKIISLLIACILFTLAALIKITALASVLVIAFFWVAERIKLFSLKKDGSKVFNKLSHALPLLMIFITVAVWTIYARYYNAIHNSEGFFLTHPVPIWTLPVEQRAQIWKGFFQNVLFNIHNPFVLILIPGLLIFIILKWKAGNIILNTASLLLFAGSIMFFMLFFYSFEVHDYFATNWLITIPAILIAAFIVFQKRNAAVLKKAWFNVILVLLFAYSMYYSAVITRTRYFHKDAFVHENTFTFGKDQHELFDWYHWYYENTIEACETMQPYLEEIGIGKKEPVISLPDPSPNISLIMLDRPGFTDFHHQAFTGEEHIKQLIEESVANYLLINFEPYVEKWPFLKKYLGHQIGAYKNVKIYDVKPYKKNK